MGKHMATKETVHNRIAFGRTSCQSFFGGILELVTSGFPRAGMARGPISLGISYPAFWA